MARRTVEILTAKRMPERARLMLEGLHKAMVADGDRVVLTQRYQGRSDWLVLFGVGHALHDRARKRQVERGGHAALWDLGYFGRAKEEHFSRVSVDRDHPQHLLDRAPLDPARWEQFDIALREQADPAGPILLIGLGRKTRAYLGLETWEARALQSIERRYPGRRVLHRPKPKQDYPRLHCERDDRTPIETLLKGASLVVCRHSNVAIDATIAGVPFEAEDGAAMWLAAREFSAENRLQFLQRLAWFQWRPAEAAQAWRFVKGLAS